MYPFSYIPNYEPFYRHPVPGFIFTGIVTAAFLVFMLYVWAKNFGPLAPSRRSRRKQPGPQRGEADDDQQARAGGSR